MKEKELNEILETKVREAKDFFETHKIVSSKEENIYSVEIPSFSENSNYDEKTEKFHWTRLSVNSNIGCVIE